MGHKETKWTWTGACTPQQQKDTDIRVIAVK